MKKNHRAHARASRKNGTSEKQLMLVNDMAQMFGPNNPWGFSNPNAEQVTKPDSLFKNLRYYLISNNRQLISQMYVEMGLVQCAVDMPVNDGMRGGIKFNSKQLSEAQLTNLAKTMTRKGDFRIAGQACKWARAFGGGAVLPILSDQDPSKPLEMEAVTEGSKLFFKAVDMWELFTDGANSADSMDPTSLQESTEFYSYYNVPRLHHTRVFRMNGPEPPSFVRPRLRGWGMSVIEKTVNGLNMYDKNKNAVYEYMDEYKINVLKLKGLSALWNLPDGMSLVQKRVAIANMMKNYQNAIALDKDDDFDFKQLNLAGLGEIQQGNRMQVASELRTPLTKLFGISAAGFSSGEDDIENYNAMVEGEVREPITPLILRMAEMRCQEMYGVIPDDLELEFEPLRVLSAEGEENVKTQMYNRLHQARNDNFISPEDYVSAVNKHNLLGIQVKNYVPPTPEPGEEEETGMEGGDGEESSLTAKSAKEAKEAPEAKK